MRQAAKGVKPGPKTTPKESGILSNRQGWLIAFQLMDTTWRVAIPILLLCYIGIQIDKHNNSSPLFTLIGLFASLIISTLLVYRQIKSLYPEFFKGGKS